MNVTAALTTTALVTTLVAAAPAWAQDTSAAPAAAAPTTGVISYPPEFFAAAQPTTALDMLQRLPGFSLDTGDSVRGFEGAAGNVLLDSRRPATKTDNLEEILRRVPASQVARIDLIRGGAPGIDMQGKSVLANVIRKEGAGFRGLVSLSGRTVYDGRETIGARVELSGGEGKRSWEASANLGKGIDDGAGEGPGVYVTPAGVITRRSDVDQEGDTVQLTLTGAYSTPLLGGQAKLNARLFNDDYKFDEVNHILLPTVTDEFTVYTNDETETEFGGSFLRGFGDKTTLELIGIRQDARQKIVSDFRSTTDRSTFALDRDTSETIGRGVLKYRANDQLSFEAGGEVAINILKSETSLTDNGAPVELPAANVRVQEDRGEAFLKTVWKPTPAWTVEGGLRYEASSIESGGDVGLEKTLYYAKPRIAVSWAPMASTQVRFRFERVVDQLDFDDFVADSSVNTGVITAGNPDLVPEQAWVSEAAVEQRFKGGAAIVLTARHFAISDVVDRAPAFTSTGVFDAPSNIGDGTKDEFAITANLPLDFVGFKGAALRGESTWRRSEVEDPTTGKDREISGLRPNEWEVHFTHDIPVYRLTWGVDLWSGWRETYYRFDEVSTDKLKPFMTVFAEWKPRAGVVIRGEVQNATERGFRHTREVFGGPRSTSTLQFTDDRDIQIGRIYWVRIRKTFGA